jgi:hypothetical protein
MRMVEASGMVCESFRQESAGRQILRAQANEVFLGYNLSTLQWSPSLFVFSNLAPGAERGQSEILGYAIV